MNDTAIDDDHPPVGILSPGQCLKSQFVVIDSIICLAGLGSDRLRASGSRANCLRFFFSFGFFQGSGARRPRNLFGPGIGFRLGFCLWRAQGGGCLTGACGALGRASISGCRAGLKFFVSSGCSRGFDLPHRSAGHLALRLGRVGGRSRDLCAIDAGPVSGRRGVRWKQK